MTHGENPLKKIILTTKMFVPVMKLEAYMTVCHWLVTDYYEDGTSETREVPDKIIFHTPINYFL